MKREKFNLNQKSTAGQAMLIAAIFFLVIATTVILGIAVPISKQVRIASDLVKSRSAFFLAEAGLEDVVYRIKNGFVVSGSEQVNINDSVVGVTVEDVTQGKIITATGDYQSYFRKAKVRLVIAEGIAFNYGVQMGNGGLIMGNNSEVHGNVFSNGNISAGVNARIFGTAVIAAPNGISGGRISGDVYANTCSGSRLVGENRTLHAYNPGNCNGHANLTEEGLPVDPVDLPISDEQIQNWKETAVISGGWCTEPVCDAFGNYIQDIGTQGELGPIKITGNLIVKNGATLKITGTLWVVGDVILESNAKVQLSPGVYGPDSGMIISDSEVILGNGSISEGTGEGDSFIMYISTSDSLQAITIGEGDTEAAIVYTNTGTIVVGNNSNLLEVVGFMINLSENAIITYKFGLTNTIFTNGPGGVFQVFNWREIE